MGGGGGRARMCKDPGIGLCQPALEWPNELHSQDRGSADTGQKRNCSQNQRATVTNRAGGEKREAWEELLEPAVSWPLTLGADRMELGIMWLRSETP